ncbi:hypothetical protein [uncultured Maricaulis sp.]|uniref:hypothetical protein n=1 Tax=uncultured Maricaulis sp. TaxID=174710 RepID=UPI0030DB38A5|tara:strand:+ start:150362 stop:151138 length:777 start_codon:yes stop_codon:yes gene_type:complete
MLAALGFAVWILIAIVAPIFIACFDWAEIQRAWYAWQGFNVGMLALAASIVAFGAAQLKEVRAAERNFIAELPFLPEQLSALTEYCDGCFATLVSAWKRSKKNGSASTAPLAPAPPELPDKYREVLKEIIRFAPRDVSRYLAVLLAELQIHNSRLRSLRKSFEDQSSIVVPLTVMDYIRALGVIQARINHLFPYARRETLEINVSGMTLQDLGAALRLGGVEISEIDGLQDYLPAAVERANRKFLVDPEDVLGKASNA